MEPYPQQSSITALELKLGIPPGLFFKLRDEGDDWSFFIKVQALIEAALTFLIKNELNRPALASFIENLNYKGNQGKLELIKKLKLLDPLHFDFLRLLAQFRNDMAHDIRFVGFSLPKHLESKSDKELRSFIFQAACLPHDSKLTINKKVRSQLLTNPKLYFWLGAMDCLVRVYLHDQIATQKILMDGLYSLGNLGFAPVGGLNQLASAYALRNQNPPRGLLDYEPPQ